MKQVNNQVWLREALVSYHVSNECEALVWTQVWNQVRNQVPR